MKNAPPTDIQIYGAAALLQHLGSLLTEAPGVTAAQDIECIHRMRVASRRLRAALAIFEPHLPRKRADRWQEQVRTLTKALGAARDADVQIEWVRAFYQNLPAGPDRPGAHRLLLRLQQQRQALQPRVRRTLSRFEKSGTALSLTQTLSPLANLKTEQFVPGGMLYQWAEQSITRRLDEFLAFAPFIAQPEAQKELHAMRIAGKRLRYTLEIFAELYPDALKRPLQTLRKAQDLLGQIHDDDVWQVTLPELLAQERQRTLEYYGTLRPFNRLQPGMLAFAQHCHEDRTAAYAELVNAWADWENRQIWTALRQSVIIPAPEDPLHEPTSDPSPAADA